MKLYPPNIEGAIPAFAGTTMVVPFSLNRAVSRTEIRGFALKVKSIPGNVLLGTFKQLNSNNFSLSGTTYVSFDISDLETAVGQYYKIQIAYVNKENEVGYYSTVGTIKYIAAPSVTIAGLNAGDLNNHMYSYTGVYNQDKRSKDTSEKLYSSIFTLYDENKNIIKTSGEIFHTTLNDEDPYEANEVYDLETELKENTPYYLQFSVTTINGYSASSPKYRIIQQKFLAPEIKAEVTTKLDYNDGYIDVFLKGKLNDLGMEEITSGNFIVCKASSKDNYNWNKLYEFSIEANFPSRKLLRDFTIEQGVTYKYCIQQFNEYGIYSDKIISKPIVADFEDMFLYDGDKQLKIKYNPKVSSFKTNILESKVETIGGKYPFIFRNGNVSYKEFPISGLISYKMDENNFFFKDAENNIEMYDTNLTSENIAAERRFKLKVLDWLNDGNPKLFKSPTEGNYIVRILNSSLTPIDTVGRMLHTFNSTAYEIAEMNNNNLKDLKLLNLQDIATSAISWRTVELAGHDKKLDELLSNISQYIENGIKIELTDEQYGRIISYNYDLKEAFKAEETSLYYNLMINGDSNILNKVKTILGSAANEDRRYSSTEYLKIINKAAELKDYFEPQVTSTIYTFDGSVLSSNRQLILNELEKIIGKVTYATGRINTRPIKSVSILHVLPGTTFVFTMDDNSVQNVVIGSNGSYYAEFDSPIVSIEVPRKLNEDSNGLDVFGLQGSITYTYEYSVYNNFKSITSVQNHDIPLRQWIGAPSRTYFNTAQNKNVVTHNLLEVLNNNKQSVTNISFIRFEKRPILPVYCKILQNYNSEDEEKYYKDSLPEGVHFVESASEDAKRSIKVEELYYETIDEEEKIYYTLEKEVVLDPNRTYFVKIFDYYIDRECTKMLDLDNLEENYLYQILHGRYDYTYSHVRNEEKYIDANFKEGNYISELNKARSIYGGYYIDGKSTSENIQYYTDKQYSTKVAINDEIIDLEHINDYYLINKNTMDIDSIEIGNGVIAEMSYQVQEIYYNLEDENDEVKQAKENYEGAVRKFEALQKIYVLESDKELALSSASLNSIEKSSIEAEYAKNINDYLVIISKEINEINSLSDSSSQTEEYNKIEKRLLKNIENTYDKFIKTLNIALIDAERTGAE